MAARTPSTVNDWTDTTPAASDWQDVRDWQDAKPVERPTGFVQGAKDLMAGIGSGAISTGVGAYNLARKLPVLDKALPPPSQAVQDLTKAPPSIPGQVGHYAEQAAEYALPAGAARGAGVIARTAANALGAAGVAGVQSGGDLGSMATAGTLGAAATAIPAAVGAAKQIATNPAVRDAAVEALPSWGKRVVKFGKALAGQSEPVPYEPVRPNPNIAAKMRYGGPPPPEYGATPGKSIPRGTFTPPPEAPPAAPEPFKPGAATQRNMGSYPGPQSPSYGPAQRLPPGTPAALPEPPEIVPQAPTPVRPNPNIARLTKYGGPTKTKYGAPNPMPRRAAGPSPATSQAPEADVPPPAPVEAAPAAEAPPPSFEPAYTPPEGAPTNYKAPAEHYQTGARTVKGRAIARLLRDNDKTPEIVSQWKLGGPELKQAAAAAGVNPPTSPESLKVVLDELGKMGPKKPLGFAKGGVVIPRKPAKNHPWRGGYGFNPKRRDAGPPPMPK